MRFWAVALRGGEQLYDVIVRGWTSWREVHCGEVSRLVAEVRYTAHLCKDRWSGQVGDETETLVGNVAVEALESADNFQMGGSTFDPDTHFG